MSRLARTHVKDRIDRVGMGGMLKVEDVWKVAPGLPTPRREQRGGGEDAEGRGCSLCSCKGGVLFSKGGCS